MRTYLICYLSLYTTFLSEAEYGDYYHIICYVHVCLNCVEYFMRAVLDTISVKTGRKSATLSESAEIIVLVLLIFSLHKIGFVWNGKITACSSVMTNSCHTSKYRTITHSVTGFVHKTNTINVL